MAKPSRRIPHSRKGRAMHSIWAVAKNTIAQAVRMKVAAVIILLLLVLLPMMSVIMTGDGTLVGKLQSFSSYGISLVSFLLSLLTIAVSCYSLSTDLRRRTLDLVITKPIMRYQIVLGKFLGTTLLSLFLLIGFACIVYGLTRAVPMLTDADPQERAQADTEFFTARRTIQASIDTEAITQRVQKRLEELKATNQLSEEIPIAQTRATLMAQEENTEKSIEVSAIKEWNFEGVYVPPDPNAVLFVRYKFEAVPEPPNSEIYGQWRIGDFRQFQTAARQFNTPIYGFERSASVRDVHEFTVTAKVVAEDGHVTIGFYNAPDYNFSTVIFSELELLYKVGSFGMNFSRVVMLIAIRLIFLAALGVSLSTWLSFPVAILCSLAVFFAGLVNGFFLDAINSLGAVMGLVYQFTIKWFLYIIPRFDGPYSPAGYIVSGEILPWLFLVKAVLITLGIQMLLLIAVGILIFRRREIAKVTV